MSSTDVICIREKIVHTTGSVAQLVERPPEERKVTGSMPVGATQGSFGTPSEPESISLEGRAAIDFASEAQMVERSTKNREVAGSTPVVGTAA